MTVKTTANILSGIDIESSRFGTQSNKDNYFSKDSIQIERGPNKLECLFLAGFSGLIKCFRVRPGDYL